MSNDLAIQDVGPIERLAIKVPPGGGVLCLRGHNGSGKTTALNAAQALLSGNGRLETRDGAKSGRVEGFGAMLILGRRVTRAGEIGVSSIESKLSISDLVSPPLKDPAAADRQRIKALVSLTGKEPTPDLFREVIGDAAEAIHPATWGSGDLLEVAAKAKRELESAARNAENEASMRQGQAQACEEAAKGVDLSAPDDERALRDQHVEASGHLSVLRERQKAATQAKERIELASRRLNDLKANYKGLGVDAAKEELQAADQNLSLAEGKVVELERQLEKAKAERDQQQQSVRHAIQQLEAAEHYAGMVEQYEATLNETATTPPGTDEMDAAIQAVEQASGAIEQAAIVRRAKDSLEQAKQHRASATAKADEAARLRQAAGQIDDVLSSAISGEALHVRDGRLYTHHPKRGECLFGELSDGERITIAFDIAAPIIGDRGLLVLPQHFWEGLDPSNREHVAKEARIRHINVLTAEASSGQLRAEVYVDEGGQNAEAE